MLNKMQKLELINSADNKLKDLNFVFQYFKLLLAAKTPLVVALQVSSNRKIHSNLAKKVLVVPVRRITRS